MEILLIAACFTLFGLMLVGAIGGPWLLFAKWGRSRLLLSTLAPLAAVIAAAAGMIAAAFSFWRGDRGGVPDEIEMQLVIAAVIVAGLLLACGAVLLAALIEKKRWGAIVGLTAAPVLLVAVTALSFVGVAKVERKVSPAPVATAFSGTSTPVAASPPAAAVAPTKVEAIEAGERPEWIEADHGPDRKAFTAGPFVDLDRCWDDTTDQVAAWMRERFEEAHPEFADARPSFEVDLDRVVKAKHTERRETSVGEVVILHALVEVDQEQRERFAQAVDSLRRRVVTTNVAFSGAAVLTLLGVTHLVLRRGSGTPEVEADPGDPGALT